MEDINKPEIIEIVLREDGTFIRLKDKYEKLLLSYRIKKLIITDDRYNKERFAGENAIRELTRRLKG